MQLGLQPQYPRLRLSHTRPGDHGPGTLWFDLATDSLLDIAREKVPGASLTVADLEDPLPYDADAFDVVTAFNAIQIRGRPGRRHQEQSQVTKPGGLISILVWGPPDRCESGIMFREMGPHMPPAPPDAPRPVAWSEDGQLEQLAASAGLRPVAVADVPNSPDLSGLRHSHPYATQLRSRAERDPAFRAPCSPWRARKSVRRQPQTRRHLPAENVFRYLIARI